MARKKVDPLLLCLRYFDAAPLDLAKMALTLATDRVEQRRDEAGELKPRLPRWKTKVQKPTPVV